MAYKIEVNADDCIGCGVCEATCPDFFKIGDDGKAEAVSATADDAGCAEEAGQVCPVQCIIVEEM